MTSLNRYLDNLLHSQKLRQKATTQPKFETILTDNLQEADPFGHHTLISQIKLKNDLLNWQQIKGSMSRQQSNLTYCQKYAKILSHKYQLTSNTSSNFRQLKHKQKSSVKDSNEQEQIYRIINQAKIYLHRCNTDFDNQFQKLSYKIRQIRSTLQEKGKRLDNSDNKIEEQLTLLDLFASKINNQINRQNITPFTLFAQEIKNTTPKRSKSQIQKRKVTINNSSGKYQTNIHSKKIIDSNLLTPHSTQLLSDYDEKQKDQPEILISFKPNLENLENGSETLKYSQTDLKLSKDQTQEQKYDEISFSPVQPHRLQKLRFQAANKKDAIKEEQESLFLSNNEDEILKTVTMQIIKNVKKGTKVQRNITENTLSIYLQSVNEISLNIESIHLSICEQKSQMEIQWEQMLEYLDKDCKEIESLLALQKAENQLKDKKFLENLNHIQNELIEEIFAQKQCRKIQENVLTQLLSNLVDSLQEGAN